MSSKRFSEIHASKPGFSESSASRFKTSEVSEDFGSLRGTNVEDREARLADKSGFGATLLLVLVACCLIGASGCQMPFKSKKASTKAGQEFSCGEHCPPAVP